MDIRRRSELRAFTTKDGSEIREYLHTAVQSLAEATLAPGQSTQRHYHAVSEEIYLIVAGSGTMELDGDEQTVSADDAVLIPAGSWHTLTGGPEGVRLLCCCVPPYRDDDTYMA